MFNFEHPDFKVPLGKQEVIVTHVFAAPRQRVFRAYTDPALIPQWWGPKILTTTVDIMNVRRAGNGASCSATPPATSTPSAASTTK